MLTRKGFIHNFLKVAIIKPLLMIRDQDLLLKWYNNRFGDEPTDPNEAPVPLPEESEIFKMGSNYVNFVHLYIVIGTEIGVFHDLGPMCITLYKEVMFGGDQVLESMLKEEEEAVDTQEVQNEMKEILEEHAPPVESSMNDTSEQDIQENLAQEDVEATETTESPETENEAADKPMPDDNESPEDPELNPETESEAHDKPMTEDGDQLVEQAQPPTVEDDTTTVLPVEESIPEGETGNAVDSSKDQDMDDTKQPEMNEPSVALVEEAAVSAVVKVKEIDSDQLQPTISKLDAPTSKNVVKQPMPTSPPPPLEIPAPKTRKRSSGKRGRARPQRFIGSNWQQVKAIEEKIKGS